MNTFKIITEQQHKYKKDSLFVLVFRENNNYGVDVANSTSNFGRVRIEKKENTQYLFSVLNEFIADQQDYLEACEKVSSILSYNTFEEMILLLHTYKRNVEKYEAYAIIQMLGIEKKETRMFGGTHFIKVFRKDEEEEFGEFISMPNTNKYMFHFF
jgi:hypothetical protein